MREQTERKALPRDALFGWLDKGGGPLTFNDGIRAHTFVALPKTDALSYIFHQDAYREDGVTWQNSFAFCCAYDRSAKCMYVREGYHFPEVVDGLQEGDLLDIGTLRERLQAEVNQAVERRVGNDRRNLTICEIGSARLRRDLQNHLEYGAREAAVQRFFAGEGSSDIRFKSWYQAPGWEEKRFLSYLRDPAAYTKAEAERFFQENQDGFLKQFIENDAEARFLREVEADPDCTLQRQKRITDAVKQCGAKTVTVTIQKEGQELRFKTEASGMTGPHSSYGSYYLAAPDRRRFEELFGRHTGFMAEEVTRITYGRNTIYEARPLAQAQAAEDAPAQEMTMGGM